MKVNKLKFDSLKHSGKCDCCYREADIVTVAGTFGCEQYNYNICIKCMEKELVPYTKLVEYASKYTNEIRDNYIKSIEKYLIKYNKSEEEFRNDIKYSMDSLDGLAEVLSLIGTGKYYEGKYIKDLVLQYVITKQEEDYDEIIEFYENYVEGREYFPIANSIKYKLDWVQSSIIPTSELVKK